MLPDTAVGAGAQRDIHLSGGWRAKIRRRQVPPSLQFLLDNTADERKQLSICQPITVPKYSYSIFFCLVHHHNDAFHLLTGAPYQIKGLAPRARRFPSIFSNVDGDGRRHDQSMMPWAAVKEKESATKMIRRLL